MAGSIKGIIVEIGGDTSGLQKALSQVNKQTSSLSKELRGINSLLKLDPSNTTLLAQKQKVLSENINKTSETLNKLKEAQKQFIAAGGDINGENYRKLQREIINTEQKLKNLKVEASNWTTASKQLEKIGTSFEALGNTISKVGSTLTKTITAPIAALATAGVTYNTQIEKYTTAFETFLGSAEKAEEVVANIKKDAAATPFDTQTLVSSNQMLVSTGESAENARDVILSLGNAIAATGGGNAELSRMAVNLQQIKNAGKATALDIKQFAYAGIDVYGILAKATGKTTQEVKDMDVTYEDLVRALKMASSEGGKYAGAMDKISQTTSGQFSILKANLQDLLGQMAQSLMPTIKSIAQWVNNLTQRFSKLSDEQKANITKMLLFAAGVGPVLTIIGKLFTTIGKVSTKISSFASMMAKAKNGVGGLGKVFTTLSGPVGIVIAVIGALTAAFAYLYKTNETFRNKVQETWQNISNFFQTSILPIIKKIGEIIGSVLGTIWSIIQQIWSTIEPFIAEIFTTLMNWWNTTGSEIAAVIAKIIETFVAVAQAVFEKFVKPIIEVLTQVLKPVIGAVFGAISGIISGILDVITGIWNSIKGVLGGIIDFITGVFTGNWKKAWEGVSNIFKSIASGLGAIFKAPINFIIGIINGFIRGLNKIKIPDWVPAVGGKGINIPEIPKLAKGGVVDSATLAMIGEGKSAEAVVPLDGTLTKYLKEALNEIGGRNIQVNFYPQQMTEAEMNRAFNYVDRRYGLAY